MLVMASKSAAGFRGSSKIELNPRRTDRQVLRGLKTLFLTQKQLFAYLQQGIVSVICDKGQASPFFINGAAERIVGHNRGKINNFKFHYRLGPQILIGNYLRRYDMPAQ